MNREEARCPYEQQCGGCRMDGRSYARTLEEKRVSMEKLLAPHLPEGWRSRITGMDDPFHYRNKVHRAFGAVSKGRKKVWTSGIYREGTHEIIEVRDCLIEDRRAVETLTRVRKLIDDFHLPYYDEDTGNGLIRHLLVRTAHKTGEMLLVIVTGSTWFPGKKNFAEALRKHCPEITTAVLNLNDRRTSLILGPKDTVLYGRGFIEDELAGLRFRISASSFYQVNSLMTEKLYQKAIDYASLTSETSVIDAYSGIGTIGMAAAGSAKDVLSIELNENAVRDARKNAERNNIQNVRFLRADATEALTVMAADSPYGDGSRLVLFMDPPRQGSTPEFIRAAVSMNPARIVYISCGPETLARDLRLFAKLGYKAREAECFDMFPFTGHVETVVQLSKGNIPSEKVRVEFDLKDMDMSVFRQGATYEQIQEWVQEKYGFHVTHLNIAQVKRKHGIIERENYNKPKSPDSRQPGCPEEKTKAIEDALKHFQMI